jgi:hypothetical protein
VKLLCGGADTTKHSHHSPLSQVTGLFFGTKCESSRNTQYDAATRPILIGTEGGAFPFSCWRSEKPVDFAHHKCTVSEFGTCHYLRMGYALGLPSRLRKIHPITNKIRITEIIWPTGSSEELAGATGTRGRIPSKPLKTRQTSGRAAT